MTKEETTEILVKLGKKLGFQVGTEIEASGSAWLDVVWFDDKFDFGPKKGEKWSEVKTRRHPVFPVVGFEIEASAGSKLLKGSLTNLNNLGALMSIIVLTEENISKVRKKGTKWSKEPDEAIWEELMRRTTQWIYESRPFVRMVIMTEPEVRDWARNKGVL